MIVDAIRSSYYLHAHANGSKFCRGSHSNCDSSRTKIVNWIMSSYDIYIHSISDDSVDPVGVYTSPLKREHSFQNICISGLMYKIKNGIWCQRASRLVLKMSNFFFQIYDHKMKLALITRRPSCMSRKTKQQVCPENRFWCLSDILPWTCLKSKSGDKKWKWHLRSLDHECSN